MARERINPKKRQRIKSDILKSKKLWAPVLILILIFLIYVSVVPIGEFRLSLSKTETTENVREIIPAETIPSLGFEELYSKETVKEKVGDFILEVNLDTGEEIFSGPDGPRDGTNYLTIYFENMPFYPTFGIVVMRNYEEEWVYGMWRINHDFTNPLIIDFEDGSSLYGDVLIFLGEYEVGEDFGHTSLSLYTQELDLRQGDTNIIVDLNLLNPINFNTVEFAQDKNLSCPVGVLRESYVDPETGEPALETAFVVGYTINDPLQFPVDYPFTTYDVYFGHGNLSNNVHRVTFHNWCVGYNEGTRSQLLAMVGPFFEPWDPMEEMLTDEDFDVATYLYKDSFSDELNHVWVNGDRMPSHLLPFPYTFFVGEKAEWGAYEANPRHIHGLYESYPLEICQGFLLPDLIVQTLEFEEGLENYPLVKKPTIRMVKGPKLPNGPDELLAGKAYNNEQYAMLDGAVFAMFPCSELGAACITNPLGEQTCSRYFGGTWTFPSSQFPDVEMVDGVYSIEWNMVDIVKDLNIYLTGTALMENGEFIDASYSVWAEGLCEDDIPVGECGEEQPLYCRNDGLVVDNCQLCGCPPQTTCRADGMCRGAGGKSLPYEQGQTGI